MKYNQKYLLTGVFILISFFIGISIWLWFSDRDRQVYYTYLTVFHEPIDGVNTSSMVKYNGVEVGGVDYIELDKNNPNNIRVYLNIKEGVPVLTTTYATIKPQGITGLSYIDLRVESQNDYVIIKPSQNPPYPEIATKNSLFFSLSEQAKTIGDNFKDVSGQAKILLNDQNLEHIANTLTNLDKISNAIATKSVQIQNTIEKINVVLTNIDDGSKNLGETIQQINQLTKNLNDVMIDIKNITLQNVNNTLLPNINQSVVNINNVTLQMQELLQNLNNNPSILLRGRGQVYKGPGE